MSKRPRKASVDPLFKDRLAAQIAVGAGAADSGWDSVIGRIDEWSTGLTVPPIGTVPPINPGDLVIPDATHVPITSITIDGKTYDADRITIKPNPLYDDVLAAKKERRMAALTVKWYEAVAEVVASTVLDPDERREVALRLADVFKDTPKFDRARFIATCAPEEAPTVSAAVRLDRARIISEVQAIPTSFLDLAASDHMIRRMTQIVLDEDGPYA